MSVNPERKPTMVFEDSHPLVEFASKIPKLSGYVPKEIGDGKVEVTRDCVVETQRYFVQVYKKKFILFNYLSKDLTATFTTDEEYKADKEESRIGTFVLSFDLIVVPNKTKFM